MRSRRSWQGGGPRVGVRGRDQQDLTGQRVTRQLINPVGLVNNSILYCLGFFQSCILVKKSVFLQRHHQSLHQLFLKMSLDLRA